ncbi:agglutinin-like protein 2 [Balamuthia mandrillaris]
MRGSAGVRRALCGAALSVGAGGRQGGRTWMRGSRDPFDLSQLLTFRSTGPRHRVLFASASASALSSSSSSSSAAASASSTLSLASAYSTNCTTKQRKDITFPDGREYSGEWENDQPNGQGCERNPNLRYLSSSPSHNNENITITEEQDCFCYVGQFVNGKKQGKGSLRRGHRDGEVLVEGAWEDNRLLRGKERSADGTIYEGEFSYSLYSIQQQNEEEEAQERANREEEEEGQALRVVIWQREGKGTTTNREGTQVYSGGWKAGREHGRGTISWPQDQVAIEGEWAEGRLVHGKQTSSDGVLTYEGQFDENLRFHGKGKARSNRPESPHVYSGEWVHGDAHGYGFLHNLKDDSRYQGQMLNGKPHGFGTLTSFPPSAPSPSSPSAERGGTNQSTNAGEADKQEPNEADSSSSIPSPPPPTTMVYEGHFKYGQREGQGKQDFGDGRVYEGEFRNDLAEGSGRLLDRSTGDFYEGQWRQGQQHGRGRLHSLSEGKVVEGQWRCGLLHGVVEERELLSLGGGGTTAAAEEEEEREEGEREKRGRLLCRSVWREGVKVEEERTEEGELRK